jgi:hypothetical protein
VSDANRTRHYRTLAGHLRLWAEGTTAMAVREELYAIAARLDQLAGRIDATYALGASRIDRAGEYAD